MAHTFWTCWSEIMESDYNENLITSSIPVISPFSHPILLQLSPKKTWEGFIGGFFSTVVFGFMVRTLSSAFFTHSLGLVLVLKVPIFKRETESLKVCLPVCPDVCQERQRCLNISQLWPRLEAGFLDQAVVWGEVVSTHAANRHAVLSQLSGTWFVLIKNVNPAQQHQIPGSDQS